MRVNTIKNLACVRLDVKTKEMKKVAKHNPEALIAYEGEDEKKSPKFMLSLADDKDENCCIERYSKDGAFFVDVDDEPILWICLPGDAIAKKGEYLVEEHGMMLSYIKQIEKQIKDSVSSVNDKVKSLFGAIKDVDDTEKDD